MREGWKKYRFDEIALFPPKIKMKKGQLYPYIPMENLDGGHKYVKSIEKKELKGGGAKFEEGDTLFARITPCLQNGKIAQAKDLGGHPAFGSTEYFVFRGIEGVSNNDFIYYLSKTQYFRRNAENSMVGASGRQRADAGFVKRLKINLPPLPTQRKIASILSAYDELIENNLKRIQLLEEQAQLTYEEWFVRLKFPGHENTAINKETGLPDGWEKVKLGDILKRVQTTKKIKTSEILEEGNIPVVDQSRDFIRGYTNDKDSLLDYNVPLIVFGDHTRIVKFINFPFARGADGTQIILSKESKMPQHLFYYVIKNIDLSDYHYSRHFKYLKDFDINIPKLHQSNNYEHIVAKKFQLIKSLRDQNKLLKEARDILLPRLMMGLIDVDELEVEINDYVLPENN